MAHTNLCPCGSGKSQEHCCGETASAGLKLRQIMIWAGILAIVGVMTAVGISSQQKSAVDATSPVTAISSTPQPWQYDPITNQHWDPTVGHQHWHAGPPPADQIATGLPGQAALPNLNVSATQPLADGSSLPNSLQNPEPWQYDEASNKHWNPTPGHVHWHDGPPPEGFEQGAATPQPWEYDAVNDRHWHPEHAHWHDGPAPAQNSNPGG